MQKICWEQFLEEGGGKDAQIIFLFIFIFIFYLLFFVFIFIFFIFFGGGDELQLYYEVGRTLFYLFFILFFAGGTLSQIQSTNNWYKSSNLTYNLILSEATLSLTCCLFI